MRDQDPYDSDYPGDLLQKNIRLLGGCLSSRGTIWTRKKLLNFFRATETALWQDNIHERAREAKITISTIYNRAEVKVGLRPPLPDHNICQRQIHRHRLQRISSPRSLRGLLAVRQARAPRATGSGHDEHYRHRRHRIIRLVWGADCFWTTWR